MGTALANNDHDDDKDDKDRKGNKEARELDTVMTDLNRLRSMDGAEHGDKIVSDAHVLAQMDVGEETHHVMANR